MKALSFFVHPLMIPFYAFWLMMEIERQSYSLDLLKNAMLLLVMFIVIVLYPYIFKFNFSFKSTDGLEDIEADFRTRITFALYLSVFYVVFSVLINHLSTQHDCFYTWGFKCVFYIFLCPLWVNIFSGNAFKQIFPKHQNLFLGNINVAPGAFVGALSGLILMLGYNEGLDTFWPFIISLLIFGASGMYYVSKYSQRFSFHFYAYLFGFLQSAIIVLIMK